MTTAVILAGGLGTRLAEETAFRPKPMVEIGGQPILWHIMKAYSAFGINKFVICLGYKGDVIKDYFANYLLHRSDITFFLNTGNSCIHQREVEPWAVTLVDTGADTMIGGRIKRILPYVKDDPYFCLTYGDGLSDVDIGDTIRFHKHQGRLATVTATRAPGRFGTIESDGNCVTAFREKPAGDWINGGFFVLSPRVGDFIAGDDTVWERQPLEGLTAEGQLSVYYHEGFWHPMDSIHDKRRLEALWESGNPPWKVW